MDWGSCAECYKRGTGVSMCGAGRKLTHAGCAKITMWSDIFFGGRLRKTVRSDFDVGRAIDAEYVESDAAEVARAQRTKFSKSCYPK